MLPSIIVNTMPLHVAVYSGKSEIVIALSSRMGGLGMTLLHSACVGGNVSLVRTLIQEYKADNNTRNEQHNILFMFRLAAAR